MQEWALLSGDERRCGSSRRGSVKVGAMRPCAFPPCARSSRRDTDAPSGRYCSNHYRQVRAGEALRPLYEVGKNPKPKVYEGDHCPWPRGCDRPRGARKYCDRHRVYLAQIKHRYGLTLDEWLALPTSCQVCGRTENLHVDHCHTSGQVRGRLCGQCNQALGLVADDPALLRALADYLERA